MAEFACKRDLERVWEGSPWHISKHAVILSEFDDFMRPSELSFDKLQVWARVVNLPFNLQDEAWSRAIAKQLDKNATDIHFDHGEGYLRALITLDVAKPLRRSILIESARRGRLLLMTYNMKTSPTSASHVDDWDTPTCSVQHLA